MHDVHQLRSCASVGANSGGKGWERLIFERLRSNKQLLGTHLE